MADVAIRALGTVENIGGDDAVTPPIPAGAVVGDLLALICFNAAGRTATCSAGWDERHDAGAGGYGSWCVYTRVFQTGDGNPTVTFSGSCNGAAVIFSLQDADTSTIFDVAISALNFDAPADPFDQAIPGFDTVTDGALAFFCWMSQDDNTWDYAEAGGGTQQVSTNPTTGVSWCIATKAMASAGGTGDQTARQTTKGGDAGRWVKFAIKPTGVAALTVSETETYSVTDTGSAAVSAQPTLEPSETDTATVTEAVALNLSIAVVAIDSATATDSAEAAVSAQATLEVGAVETATVTDSGAASVVEGELPEDLAASGTDACTVSETVEAAVSAQPTLEPSVADTYVVSEAIEVAVSAQATIEPSVADTLTCTDVAAAAVSAQAALEIQVAEIVAVTDIPAVTVIAQVALELAALDSVNLSEAVEAAVSAQPTLEPSVVDALTVADEGAALVTGDYFASVADTVSVGEAVSVSISTAAGGGFYPWLRRRRRM